MVVLLVSLGSSQEAYAEPEAEEVRSEQKPEEKPPEAELVERTPVTERSFDGMSYRFPLRLILLYGGSLEGALGGVDSAANELLLMRPQRSVRVHFKLIDKIEPLAPLLTADALGVRPPAPSVAGSALKLKWKPTWRSHLGAVMSFVLPGTGQFIQRDERAIGVLFLASDLFFLTASMLAFFGPSQLAPSHRKIVGGTFAGLALTTSLLSSIHAFKAGMEPAGGFAK